MRPDQIAPDAYWRAGCQRRIISRNAISSEFSPQTYFPIVSKFLRITLACMGLPFALGAHPMGNFSVSHYSRLHFKPGVLEVTYVLDLAEIPAFQLLGTWQIDWKDQASLAAKSKEQAAEWLGNLSVTEAGKRLPLRILSASPTAVEGAGGLPVLRIVMKADAPAGPGELTYEDNNFPGRAGWKEIVVDHDRAVKIASATHTNRDISKALTFYPTDPAINQPQDVSARVEWSVVKEPEVPVTISSSAPVAPAVPFSAPQAAGPGAVVRGDYLSKMLQKKELSGGIILLGIFVAFGLGAMHAMSPGHGKTIVAAYLVGSRGTLKHAGLLGLTVTFTHTFTVFLLGLGILFFQRFFVAEKVVPLLGAVSGLSIVAVGLTLLYRRANALLHGGADHTHSVSELPPRRSRIAELRAAEAGIELPEFEHSHGGSTHSHMIEGDITPGSLIALGVSGGIVPCPSALILMLSAIALGHAGLGLVLLIGFSTGLALVLMVCGGLAVYAKHLLPGGEAMANRPAFRLIPVFSAVVVICLGLAMTGVSAGWIQPLRFLS
jgi:nickel/cobalt exporter